LRCLAVIVASLTAVSAVCAAAQKKSAASMRDSTNSRIVFECLDADEKT